MSAYDDYVRQVTEQRLTDLRRQADQYRLVASLKAGQPRRRLGSVVGLSRRAARRSPATPIVKPVRLPRPGAGEDLRRSA